MLHFNQACKWEKINLSFPKGVKKRANEGKIPVLFHAARLHQTNYESIKGQGKLNLPRWKPLQRDMTEREKHIVSIMQTHKIEFSLCDGLK
jgi:hypothetical protein